MSQYAELPDGTRLEFPDDAPLSVIQSTVRKMLGAPDAPGVAKPALPGRLADGTEPQTLDDLRHAKLGIENPKLDRIASIANQLSQPEWEKKAGGAADLGGYISEAAAPAALAMGGASLAGLPIRTILARVLASGGGAAIGNVLGGAAADYSGAGPNTRRILQGAGEIAGGGVGMKVGSALAPDPAATAAAFESVMQHAGNQPINTGRIGQVALDSADLMDHGNPRVKVLTDVLREVTQPGSAMDYRTGRDFASAAGALSNADQSTLNPRMRAQVAQLAEALATANRDAADRVGMGQAYDNAMRDYRRDAKLQNLADVLAKYGKIAAIGAGGGLAGKVGYDAYKAVK